MTLPDWAKRYFSRVERYPLDEDMWMDKDGAIWRVYVREEVTGIIFHPEMAPGLPHLNDERYQW